MALYMISFITYGGTLAFYMAAFPRLARNTPRARQLLNEYRRGKISVEEYEIEESLEKNRICNTTTVSSWLTFFSFPLSSPRTDPQLPRIHYHTVLDPGFIAAFERQPNDQKLCFGIVRAGLL